VQEAKWLQQVREYVADKVTVKGRGQGRKASDLNALLAGNEHPRVGLLVSERVVNMPPELAPSIFASLMEDLSWARANAAHKDLFSFDVLVNLSPCFAHSQKTASKVDCYFYYRFEEEFFHAQASTSLWFATPSSDTTVPAPAAAAVGRKREHSDSSASEDDKSLRPPQGRRIIVFPAAAMQPCQEAMQHAVSLAASDPLDGHRTD
jgi:hypothetical protein